MDNRKVTFDDIVKFKFVGDPQLSPDGERVVFTVTTPSVEKNGYETRLWVSDLGGRQRQLTYSPKSDGGLVRDTTPRWAPNGKELLFLSNRGGQNQIYLLGEFGEARLLAELAEAPGEPVWSPDGRHVAFTMKDKKEEEKDANPDVRVIRRLRYKFNGIGFLDERRRHIYIIDTVTGELKQLTSGDWDDSSPAWSPDGRWIAFSSYRGEGEVLVIPDIWKVPVSGGDPVKLTEGKGPSVSPSWSPDGQYLLYLGHDQYDKGYPNTGLWIIPADGGQATNLTAQLDRGVGCSVGSDSRMDGGNSRPIWLPDGRSIYFTMTDGGACNLYRVDTRSGKVSRISEGLHSITSFDAHFGRKGARFAYTAGEVLNPGDIWLLEEGDRIATRLTSVNAELLREMTLTPAERIEFRSTDGLKIEGWVMKPADFEAGRKYPLVLQIHGGPHATYGYGFFHEFQLLTSAGYGVLYVNPRGSLGYGEEFTRGVVGDWGGMDYADLMAATDYAAKLPWVDADRLGVTGGSYGGYMTNWIVTQTRRFRAAVTLRSISNMYTKYGVSDIGWFGNKAGMGGRDLWDSEEFIMSRSPIRYAPQVKTPVLIIHSEEDYRCPMEQAEQWFVALKRLGVECEFVRFRGENHELSRSGKPKNRISRLQQILGWFDRFLR